LGVASRLQRQDQELVASAPHVRRLSATVGKETETYLDNLQSPEVFASRRSYYGNALVSNLHGHHGWEDRSYFPKLSAADPRLDVGFRLLNKDHQDLDIVLDEFAKLANRAIKLVQCGESQIRQEADQLHRHAPGPTPVR